MGPKLAPNAAFAVVKEHGESDEFWAALGGKAEYPNTKTMGFAPGFQPRLYEVSNASGYSNMKVVDDFLQEDLDNNAVMVLDCYGKMFMWVGIKSNPVERKSAAKKIQEFVDNSQDGRPKDDVDII